MSIENKLTYLNGTKDAIKQAIIGKGVSVTEADTFRSYASKIEEIQSGGGDCPKHTLDIRDGVNNTFKVANEIKEIILPSSLTNVTDMESCFNNCGSLTSITLPELPNVTSLNYCFAVCFSLKNITLPSNLTNLSTMYYCFSGCGSLTSVTLPSTLPNVTNISNCFMDCGSLTSVTLPELPNVTTLRYCFGYCYRITNIILQNLALMTDMYNCFYYCSSLTSITLPELPSVQIMENCFSLCSSLQNLVIGNINPNITTLTNWGISDCTALTVDSLVNIMNALPTITSTKTCTIGTTNLSKLSPEQLAIATNKGWSIN